MSSEGMLNYGEAADAILIKVGITILLSDSMFCQQHLSGQPIIVNIIFLDCHL